MMTKAALLSVCLFLAHHTASAFTVTIPRVSFEEFQAIYSQNDRDTPIIIENVLTPQECEDYTSEILSSKQAKVCLQRKRPDQDIVLYPDVDIRTAIDMILSKSKHDDALWAFEEGFLEENFPESSLTSDVSLIREWVFGNEDWFEHFPNWAQSTDCVVFAGEGGTSTLHRDPFEWTGTSLCISGSKVWRFVEPSFEHGVGEIDELFSSYRLPSTAWDAEDSKEGGGRILSAGWQSDHTLYAERDDTIPSGEEFQEMTKDEKLETIRKISASNDMLAPDLDLSANTWTAVQSEGDFLVIPAHWWHQTYSLEPSVTISSQRCSEREIVRVMEHIMATTEVGDITLEDTIDLNNPKGSVEKFFETLKTKLQ
jgi:hypothetical protein